MPARDVGFEGLLEASLVDVGLAVPGRLYSVRDVADLPLGDPGPGHRDAFHPFRQRLGFRKIAASDAFDLIAEMRVLVAGIGGASLGTEILKCLQLAGAYEIFGCDVSPYAFGHYQGGTLKTFVVAPGSYADAVLDLCRQHHIEAVIPGG